MLSRFWRGEYPLWVSFWILSLLFYISTLFVYYLLPQLLPPLAKGGKELFNIFVLLYYYVLSIISCVGVWRSASEYKLDYPGIRRIWGTLAQMCVLIAIAIEVFRILFYLGLNL